MCNINVDSKILCNYLLWKQKYKKNLVGPFHLGEQPNISKRLSKFINIILAKFTQASEKKMMLVKRMTKIEKIA